MTEQQIKYLLGRYLDETLTEKERVEWLTALNDAESRETLNRVIDAYYYELGEDQLSGLRPEKAAEVLSGILRQAPEEVVPQQSFRLWRRLAVAASFMLFLAAGGYFLLHKKSDTSVSQVAVQHDILPGSDKAVLTLSDGRKINLNDLKSGLVAEQRQARITKTADGGIVYAANRDEGEVQYNTILTPRGGQWPELVLPDGTKVMLDAASSIRYPVAFRGKERLVEITGQVYFEVVHREDQPFRVKAGNQVIEDVGTVFNINAYSDEPEVRTTLVSGAAKVANSYGSVLLRPGQQASAARDARGLKVKSVDVSDALAWRKGRIALKGEDLTLVMRQVSRWYDVDVVYQGEVPKRVFAGSLSRNVKLDDLLKALAFYNIRFDVAGNKITVRP